MGLRADLKIQSMENKSSQNPNNWQWGCVGDIGVGFNKGTSAVL